MKSFSKILIFGFGFFLLQGCYYDVEEDLYPVVDSCNTTNLVFNGEIQPLINTHCALSGCHVAGTGRVDFTTYEGVKSVAADGRLHQKVIVDKSMPPSGPLPKCEMDKIDAWIKAGFPKN